MGASSQASRRCCRQKLDYEKRGAAVEILACRFLFLSKTSLVPKAENGGIVLCSGFTEVCEDIRCGDSSTISGIIVVVVVVVGGGRKGLGRPLVQVQFCLPWAGECRMSLLLSPVFLKD